MTICEEIFQYPRLATIQNPPPEFANLPGYTCAGLGDRDTDLMLSPAGVLVHEYMHWSYLFRHVPRFNNYIRDGMVQDYKGPHPNSGYGFFNAARLRALSIVENPRFYHDNQVLQNADNYARYALSKYWSFICGKTFGPTQDSQDELRRIPIPGLVEPSQVPFPV